MNSLALRENALPELVLEFTERSVVSDQQLIDSLYKRAGLGGVMEAFAFSEPLHAESSIITSEDHVLAGLAEYCSSLSPFLVNGDEVNVAFARMAVDKVFAGMNLAASKKLGFKQPRSTVRRLLEKAGAITPEPGQYFAPLEDRYWDGQFLAQHASGGLIPRAEGETTQDYTARYVFTCIKGFGFGNFSYLQQADRIA